MTQESSMSERRRAPRVPISLQVQRAKGDKYVGFGYARDLSEVGLSIEGEAFDENQSLPEEGEKVEVRFKLPKGKLYIRAQGVLVRVVKSTPPCVALEFQDLDPEALEEIRSFVGSS